MSNVKSSTLPHLLTYGATMGEVVVFTTSKTKYKEIIKDCYEQRKKYKDAIGLIEIKGRKFFILPTDTMDDLKERFMKMHKKG